MPGSATSSTASHMARFRSGPVAIVRDWPAGSSCALQGLERILRQLLRAIGGIGRHPDGPPRPPRSCSAAPGSRGRRSPASCNRCCGHEGQRPSRPGADDVEVEAPFRGGPHRSRPGAVFALDGHGGDILRRQLLIGHARGGDQQAVAVAGADIARGPLIDARCVSSPCRSRRCRAAMLIPQYSSFLPSYDEIPSARVKAGSPARHRRTPSRSEGLQHSGCQIAVDRRRSGRDLDP